MRLEGDVKVEKGGVKERKKIEGARWNWSKGGRWAKVFGKR